MFETWPNLERHWEDWLNILLGVLLALSPWYAGYAGTNAATINAVAVGVALIVFAQLALVRLEAWEEWVNLALGLWLMVSPWVLGFDVVRGAFWSAFLLGAAVAVLAALELREEAGGRGAKPD